MDKGKSRIWPSLLPKNAALQPNLKWKFGSSVIVPVIATISKVWINHFNKFTVENHETFIKTLNAHYESNKKYPLLTISNHTSCCDDPGLWGGLFPWPWVFNSSRHRWSAAAEDICFTKDWHALFFSLGRTFPVVRGLGIHQKAMDFALELLKANEFLHVFPQGRIVEDPDLNLNISSLERLPLKEQLEKVTLRDGDYHKQYQLKWGLARVILDYFESEPNSKDKYIQVLPFYHIGMNQVLPNSGPYIPRPGNLVTVTVRKEGTIRMDKEFLVRVCFNGDDTLPIREKRTRIMKYFEDELKALKISAIKFRAETNAHIT
ncbi:Tafazzin [Halotydeus destructor]|nr:Tafazzin [Halotydeus destructor]